MALALVEVRLRRLALLQEEAQRRIAVNAGLLALQPTVPPALALLQEADGRPWDANMRILMSPWTSNPLGSRHVFNRA